MHVLTEIWHWLLNVTGVNIPAAGSHWYNFWSGFGSDIGEIAIIGSILTLYRHHNCHIKGCWRIGRHQVEGTPYLTCHKHATLENHAHLQKQHKHDFPEQHKLLNTAK